MSLNQYPLITVVTLVYNTGDRMGDTLGSIKNQTYPNIEHIIIDDCSSDNSAEEVQNWIEKNNYSCTFIRQTSNKGICTRLNEALQITRGKYVNFIGDDIMLPDKIMNDIVHLENNPNFAFCFSKMILRYKNDDREETGNYRTSKNLFHDLLLNNLVIPSPTITYRRDVFDKVGTYDESLFVEDFDMLLKILYKYDVGFIDKFSIIYNISSISIQQSREVAFQNEFFKVIERWRFLSKYRYYKNNRHQFAFCQFAVKNKKEAIKHLLPALTVFWQPRLYKNLLKFLFVWP